MKKLVFFLLVIGGLYSTVGNVLVESGTRSINIHSVKMQQAGV